jgi:PAS domain S-box-containing protein
MTSHEPRARAGTGRRAGAPRQGERQLRAHAAQQCILAEIGQQAVATMATMAAATAAMPTSAEMAIEALLRHAAVRLGAGLQAGLCVILDLTPGGEPRLRAITRRGRGSHAPVPDGLRIAGGPGSLASFTLLADEPVVVRDLRTEARFNAPPLLAAANCVSGLCAALRGRRGARGLLAAFSARLRHWSAEDLAFLTTMANLLALTCEHHETAAANDRERLMLQGIFDQVPVMISCYNDAGELLAVSREWERVLGWTPEETRQLDIVAARYSEPGGRRGLLPPATHLWTDFRTTTRSGRVVDTSWTRRAVADGNLVGVGLDVTERKRYATQLQSLANAALAVSAADSLEEIARVVTAGARQIIGAQQSLTSFSTDGNGGQSVLASSPAESAAPPMAPTPDPGAALDRLVCDTGRLLRLSQAELAAHPAWTVPAATLGNPAAISPPQPTPPPLPTVPPWPTVPRGWLAVPILRRDGKSLGVIRVADKDDGELGEEDEAMLVQLAQMTSQAIANRVLLHEITASRERLGALSRRLVHVQEEERRLLARELHDEVAQLLTGLKFMLEAAGQRGGRVDTSQVMEVTARLLERVRDLSLDLRPPMLDHLGLIPTLLWHFDKYRAQTGIDVVFHRPGFNRRVPPETEITAFRIIQEALSNVARHAGVKAASVAVWTEEGWLGLRVEDEGRGFDPAAPGGASTGLSGMNERARLVGGVLTLDSRPEAGTRLMARLPIPLEAA